MEKSYAVMVKGKQTPALLYLNYENAEAEATRLARQENKTVYILQVIVLCELIDVRITPLVYDDKK